MNLDAIDDVDDTHCHVENHVGDFDCDMDNISLNTVSSVTSKRKTLPTMKKTFKRCILPCAVSFILPLGVIHVIMMESLFFTFENTIVLYDAVVLKGDSFDPSLWNYDESKRKMQRNIDTDGERLSKHNHVDHYDDLLFQLSGQNQKVDEDLESWLDNHAGHILLPEADSLVEMRYENNTLDDLSELNPLRISKNESINQSTPMIESVMLTQKDSTWAMSHTFSNINEFMSKSDPVILQVHVVIHFEKMVSNTRRTQNYLHWIVSLALIFHNGSEEIYKEQPIDLSCVNLGPFSNTSGHISNREFTQKCQSTVRFLVPNEFLLSRYDIESPYDHHRPFAEQTVLLILMNESNSTSRGISGAINTDMTESSRILRIVDEQLIIVKIPKTQGITDKPMRKHNHIFIVELKHDVVAMETIQSSQDDYSTWDKIMRVCLMGKTGGMGVIAIIGISIVSLSILRACIMNDKEQKLIRSPMRRNQRSGDMDDNISRMSKAYDCPFILDQREENEGFSSTPDNINHFAASYCPIYGHRDFDALLSISSRTFAAHSSFSGRSETHSGSSKTPRSSNCKASCQLDNALDVIEINVDEGRNDNVKSTKTCLQNQLHAKNYHSTLHSPYRNANGVICSRQRGSDFSKNEAVETFRYDNLISPPPILFASALSQDSLTSSGTFEPDIEGTNGMSKIMVIDAPYSPPKISRKSDVSSFTHQMPFFPSELRSPKEHLIQDECIKSLDSQLPKLFDDRSERKQPAEDQRQQQTETKICESTPNNKGNDGRLAPNDDLKTVFEQPAGGTMIKHSAEDISYDSGQSTLINAEENCTETVIEGSHHHVPHEKRFLLHDELGSALELHVDKKYQQDASASCSLKGISPDLSDPHRRHVSIQHCYRLRQTDEVETFVRLPANEKERIGTAVIRASKQSLQSPRKCINSRKRRAKTLETLNPIYQAALNSFFVQTNRSNNAQIHADMEASRSDVTQAEDISKTKIETLLNVKSTNQVIKNTLNRPRNKIECPSPTSTVAATITECTISRRRSSLFQLSCDRPSIVPISIEGENNKARIEEDSTLMVGERKRSHEDVFETNHAHDKNNYSDSDYASNSELTYCSGADAIDQDNEKLSRIKRSEEISRKKKRDRKVLRAEKKLLTISMKPAIHVPSSALIPLSKFIEEPVWEFSRNPLDPHVP